MANLKKWITWTLNVFYPGRMLMLAAAVGFLKWITGRENTSDALRVVARWILHNPFGQRVERWAQGDQQPTEQWSHSEQPVEIA
jgi:hypothetical protein